MRRRYWVISGFVIAGTFTTVTYLIWPRPLVSNQIKSQLTSTLMLPATGRIVIDRSSVKYDSDLKLLTFNLNAFGKTIIVSEQPTPEQFTDVPAVYQKVLDGMNDYADFDTSVGSVHLTTPPQQHGLQAAVLNAKGTLLFAKPAANLSEDQWRQLFTSFSVVE